MCRLRHRPPHVPLPAIAGAANALDVAIAVSVATAAATTNNFLNLLTSVIPLRRCISVVVATESSQVLAGLLPISERRWAATAATRLAVENFMQSLHDLSTHSAHCRLAMRSVGWCQTPGCP